MMTPNKNTVIVLVSLLVIAPLLTSARPVQTPLAAFDNHPGDQSAGPLRVLAVTIAPEIIETCTPDCTAPHCTVECKCAFTHRQVTSKCSPPNNSATASLCQSWFQMCPAFNAINYNQQQG